MRAVLAAIAIALLVGASTDPVPRKTIIHFICATADSARDVALEQLWDAPEKAPADCRFLSHLGLPDQAAFILKTVEIVALEDGRFVEIGAVLRNGIEHGFSAGETQLLSS